MGVACHLKASVRHGAGEIATSAEWPTRGCFDKNPVSIILDVIGCTAFFFVGRATQA